MPPWVRGVPADRLRSAPSTPMDSHRPAALSVRTRTDREGPEMTGPHLSKGVAHSVQEAALAITRSTDRVATTVGRRLDALSDALQENENRFRNIKEVAACAIAAPAGPDSLDSFSWFHRRLDRPTIPPPSSCALSTDRRRTPTARNWRNRTRARSAMFPTGCITASPNSCGPSPEASAEYGSATADYPTSAIPPSSPISLRAAIPREPAGTTSVVPITAGAYW